VSRGSLTRIGKCAVAGLLLFFLGRYAWQHWETVRQVSAPLPVWLALATAVGALAQLLAPLALQRLVSAHGQNFAYAQAVALCHLPRLGKYVPGKVWSVAAAVHLYGLCGVPKKVAAACLTLGMGIALATATALAVGLASLASVPGIPRAACLGALAVVAVFLCPPVFYGLANTALRMSGHRSIEVAATTRQILHVAGIFVAAQLASGTGFFLLLQSFEPLAWEHFPAVVALNRWWGPARRL